MTLTSCGQDLTSSLTCCATFKTSRRSTTFPGSGATLVGMIALNARWWRTFCSFPGLTNWRAKTASTKTSSECSRLTDWRTSTSFPRLLCFPTSIRNSAVSPPSPPFGAGWQWGERLPEHLHLPIRLLCQRQGPVDHQTSSLFQRARHLLGQQREWLLHQTQQFSTFNLRIIAVVSPDVA